MEEIPRADPQTDPDRWEHIQHLLTAALKLDPQDRAAFLDQACGDDRTLRHEVRSLLQADEEAGRFLLDPPLPILPDASLSLEGRRLSHYHVMERLGGGGMGVVYKARDTRLERTVALKFLPPYWSTDEEAKARFLREAQAAAALDHPNLCTIHEVGQTDDGQLFIAMAYYRGETLRMKIARGPLPIKEALGYTAQMAEGLARAHESGIVHRDVKPANVLVTERGRVKIVDFGLAKVADVSLTRTGSTPGTVAYMSPEQARGDAVDHQTDLWSLGVVMYEMLVGTRPFRGEHAEVILYGIRHDEPAQVRALRPEVPEAVARVVETLLRKSLDERYPHASDLLLDLASLRGEHFTGETGGRAPHPAQQAYLSGASEIKPAEAGPAVQLRRAYRYAGSAAVALLGLLALILLLPDEASPPAAEATREAAIAVLPFLNMSQDEANEYFSDGMTEELINALTQVEGLRVPGRTSAFAFKGKAVDLQEVGRRLNVEHVLDGSVRRVDDQMRITAQLIRVADGSSLWSKTYDPEVENIFAVQEDIAHTIVDTLAVQLLGASVLPLVKQPTENLEAYYLYLKGRYFWNQRTRESLIKAIDYFEQAIALDSTYALAYAGVAHAYGPLLATGYLSAPEFRPRLRAAALKALELDPTLAEAHTAYYVVMAGETNWTAALEALQQAIAYNPNYATAYQWSGWVLQALGRTAENVAVRERALALDPLSPVLNKSLGDAYRLAGQYDRAIDQYEEVLELDPGFWMAHEGLGIVYLLQEQYEAAIEAFRKAITFSDSLASTRASLGHVYAVTGKTGEAHTILKTLKQPAEASPLPLREIALVHVGLGDTAEALTWLEQAYEERYAPVKQIKADERFAPLHGESRFQTLLAKMGLE